MRGCASNCRRMKRASTSNERALPLQFATEYYFKMGCGQNSKSGRTVLPNFFPLCSERGSLLIPGRFACLGNAVRLSNLRQNLARGLVSKPGEDIVAKTSSRRVGLHDF